MTDQSVNIPCICQNNLKSLISTVIENNLFWFVKSVKKKSMNDYGVVKHKFFWYLFKDMNFIQTYGHIYYKLTQCDQNFPCWLNLRFLDKYFLLRCGQMYPT